MWWCAKRFAIFFARRWLYLGKLPLAITTRTFLGLKVSYNNGDTNYNPSSSTDFDIQFTSDLDGNGLADDGGDLFLDFLASGNDPDTKVLVDGVSLDFRILTISTHAAGEDFPGTDVIIFEVTLPGDSKSTRISIYPELTNAEVATIGNGRTDLTSAPPPSPPVYDGVCFAAGTLIETDAGAVAVEDLRAGHVCRTLTGAGRATVRWAGQSRLARAHLRADTSLRVIRLFEVEDGRGDLRVSAQHRIAIRHPMLELLVGHSEMFVPAFWLADIGMGRVEPPETSVIYCHVLFDCHEAMPVHGFAAESLFLGAEVNNRTDPLMQQELEIVFPDMRVGAGLPKMKTAYPMMNRVEFSGFARRHHDILRDALRAGTVAEGAGA